MKINRTILCVFVSIICSQIMLGQRSKSYEYLRSNKTDYVLVAAHRGDWQYAPENSLLSLQHDIYWGVNLIETDIRLTKDGHLVMMHDYTVDRTTNGKGKICDLTLDEIRKLRLMNNFGQMTDMQVPTFEEYIQLAKGKVLLYLDKAGYDIPGTASGHLIKEILKVLKQYDAVEESVFVLNFPYKKAREIFGEDLEKVNYCPVIEDAIPNLSAYVDEYIKELHPVAFQFRFDKLDSETYRQLGKVIKSGSKPFVAATWAEHTANHDDNVSLFRRPSEGWGWLLKEGFQILETNYPRDVINYLQLENRRERVVLK